MSNHFHQTLMTSDGACMSQPGVILPAELVWKEAAWDKEPDGETSSVRFHFKDQPDGDVKSMVELTGDAWRTLESMGVVDDFVRLASLNAESARTLAQYLDETPESKWAFTRSLVMMDVTQSTTVLLTGSKSGEPPADDDIFNAARERSDWSVNEGNEAEVYFGDRENDVEEVDLQEYVCALIADEMAKRDPKLLRIAQLEAALNLAAGAISALSEQVDQMKGMFPDQDGAIAHAQEAGNDALVEINALRKPVVAANATL